MMLDYGLRRSRYHMPFLNKARPLVSLTSCAALALGLAGAPPAGAQLSFPTLTSKAAISWGYNAVGELGDGTHAIRTLSALSLCWAAASCRSTPFCHGLALRSNGTVWAWGSNAGGQLGDGTFEERQTPVQVMGLTGVIAVSAGITHSLALRSDGTVWAWGYGLDGELGNGLTVNNSVPVQVTGLSQITSISAGGGSSLAVRTSSTGVTSVWAWGANGDGEVGDGTQHARLTPVQVTGILARGIAGDRGRQWLRTGAWYRRLGLGVGQRRFRRAWQRPGPAGLHQANRADQAGERDYPARGW